MEKIVFSVIFWTATIVILIGGRIGFKYIYKKKTTTSVKFLSSIFSIAILMIAFFIFLSQFEQTKSLSTSLLQSSSLILAIMTFACQKVLGNVVSGLVISSVKPFDIGEKIILMDGNSKVVEGYVTDINLRHTTIKGSDEKCSLVPNSKLDEMIIVNANTMENKGYALEMECSLNADVDLAMKIMTEEILNNPLTIQRDLVQSQVLCSGFTANGFILKSVIWTSNIDDNFRACSQLRISIFKAWERAGITIPYQTITIDNQ